jgi:hypothetical protein
MREVEEPVPSGAEGTPAMLVGRRSWELSGRKLSDSPYASTGTKRNRRRKLCVPLFEDATRRKHAGRSARRPAPTTKSPRLRANRDHHPSPGHRSHHRHLHPGSPSHAEVPPSGQARRIMAHRRQDSLLQLGWLRTGERRKLRPILLGDVQAFSRPHAGVQRPGGTASGQRPAGRAEIRIPSSGRYPQRPIRLRQFLPHPRHQSLDRAHDDRRR